DGETIYARGYGMASLEFGVPLGPETVFSVASMAKQFTAASIALLALRGEISLDDDVRNHLPGLADFGETVTIRHLIHHTSGVRDYLSLRSLAGYSSKDYFDNDRIIRFLTRQKSLNFRPGEQHLYSNSGYVLLAEIVKRVSGRSLGAFAEENVFRPLGMLDTRFDDDMRRVVKNRATSYGPLEEGGFQRYLKAFEVAGPGNLLTTVGDLHRWDRNFYDPRVGGTALIELMHTRGRLNRGKQLSYALGLVHGTYRGLRTVSHDGWFVGFRAELLRFPEQRFSVAVLCNLETINPVRLAEKVADIFLSEELTSPKEAESGSTVAEAGPFVQVPQELLAELTGHYWSGEISVVREIILRDGRLFFHRGPGNESELAPLGERRFLMLGVPVHLEITFPPAAADRQRRMLVELPFKHGVWHAFEPVTPSPEALREYAGSYYSEELDAAYELSYENGELLIRFPPDDRLTLRPIFQDGFQIERVVTCRFQRDHAGRIVGMLIDSHRVRNLRFEKMRESPSR
ncbi:MAG: beta-lactamase family protein, partial [bacterium]|nr:beta-lactamase family protein [bacterium]